MADVFSPLPRPTISMKISSRPNGKILHPDPRPAADRLQMLGVNQLCDRRHHRPGNLATDRPRDRHGQRRRVAENDLDPLHPALQFVKPSVHQKPAPIQNADPTRQSAPNRSECAC